MKTISIPIIVATLALTFQLQARASLSQCANLYQKLCQLNSGWSDRAPDFNLLESDFSIADHTHLIQTHLRLVIDQLENAEVSHLTSAQLEQRLNHIQTLRTYMGAGEFPQNVFVGGYTPVFIDPWGTHCAVGHLIATSGRSELADAINREHQLDFLSTIKTAGLPEWQTASGLSFDELELIQPQYHSKKLIYPKEIEDLILGDSTAITAALLADPSLAKAHCGGKTLLHFAAAAGDLKLVKLLIEKGADPNAVSVQTYQKAPTTKPADRKPKIGVSSSCTLYQVQWNTPTNISPTNGSGMRMGSYGRVFSTPTGAAITRTLHDLYGGISGKNALYFATTKLSIPSLETLINNRAEVATWLKEQGLS